MNKRKTDYYDYNLIAVMLLLIGFGLVMLYSTSAYSAEMKFGNDMYYFSKQAIISIVAVAAAIVISLVNYHILWNLGGILYIVSLILMALVKFSGFGVSINGARRWLKFGPLSFQPSEVAKIAIIVFLPSLICRMGKKYKGVKGTLLPLGLGIISAGITYLWTENLSTGIIIFLMAFGIVFIAHPKTWGFIMVMLAGIGGVAAAVFYVATHALTGSESFRYMRVLVWLNPEEYSQEGGYQILQALYALGSGGLFGKGLGNSTQKLGAVPEAQNDMIFSIICEELGVFGGIIIVFLFIYLLYRLFFIAQNAPDLYGSLMVIGIFIHISAQVILNISVVINLIPTTGITLPFFSYGGTSVLLLLLEMSIALSVSRRIRFRQMERDLWGDVVSDVS